MYFPIRVKKHLFKVLFSSPKSVFADDFLFTNHEVALLRGDFMCFPKCKSVNF